MGALKKNIYYKWLMYLIDIIGIVSLIYIRINEEVFKVCMEKLDINNNINTNIIYILIGVIILKNILMYNYKETEGIILKITKIILNILSGGLILFTYKLYQLQTNYEDSIRLKWNIYIHRVWKKEELKEYLLEKLLNKPAVLERLERLKIKLPLPEKISSNLLKNCNTIKDVESEVYNFMSILEYNKTTLEKAYILDKKGASSETSIYSTIVEKIGKVTDISMYWWLGGLTVAVVVLAGYYYGLNNDVVSLAKNTEVVKDSLIKTLKTDKKQNEGIVNLSENTKNINENISTLNKESLSVLENKNVLSSELEKISLKFNNETSKLVENVEHLNNGLNDLSTDVNVLRNNLEIITGNVVTDITNVSVSSKKISAELLNLGNITNINNEQIEKSISELTKKVSIVSENTKDKIEILKENDKEFLSLFRDSQERVNVVNKLLKSYMEQVDTLKEIVSKIPIVENITLRKMVRDIVLEALEMPLPIKLPDGQDGPGGPDKGGTIKFIRRFGNIRTFSDSSD